MSGFFLCVGRGRYLGSQQLEWGKMVASDE